MASTTCGNRQYFRFKKNFLIGQIPGITRTVKIFVVLVYNFRNRPWEMNIFQYIVTDLGMAFNYIMLPAAEQKGKGHTRRWRNGEIPPTM